MAQQRICHPDGELAMARAAAATGLPYCLSTMATASIQEVAAAVAHGPTGGGASAAASWAPNLWFQMYVMKARHASEAMVREAERLGYSALVVTVDAPRLGHREADEKNRYELPAHLSMKVRRRGRGRGREVGPGAMDGCLAVAGAVGPGSRAGLKPVLSSVPTQAQNLEMLTKAAATTQGVQADGSKFGRHFSALFDRTLTWDFLPWLKRSTRLPVLLKVGRAGGCERMGGHQQAGEPGRASKRFRLHHTPCMPAPLLTAGHPGAGRRAARG